ncbi:hypothetical protein EVAR_72537_1 [Eumeta japonica]|uniref:Uncharacterized protein n=1 Tax=Eumeta variegata TaxID=151549 RepID=A0A4C1TIS2_EUMVA|nr:hypothetical protein EVAR_72537_1 [Eumeta japonica]
MPGLWKAQGQKGASPKPQNKGFVHIPIKYMKQIATFDWQVFQAWWCDMVYSHSVDLVHRQVQLSHGSREIMRNKRSAFSRYPLNTVQHELFVVHVVLLKSTQENPS